MIDDRDGDDSDLAYDTYVDNTLTDANAQIDELIWANRQRPLLLNDPREKGTDFGPKGDYMVIEYVRRRNHELVERSFERRVL